jgi:DNA-binding YbaB/EbfC family protein
MSESDLSPTGGLSDLVSQLQAAQAELEAKVTALDSTVVEGSAAGRAVVIRLNGSLEAESVHIDPSILERSDASLVEDAVLAALRDALGRVVELRSSLPEQVAPSLGGAMDLNAIVGNLGLEGMLSGLDVHSLMESLGMGINLGAFGGLGESGDDDENDLHDEPEA